VVDRLQGAESLCRQEGITNYQAIFSIRDFGVEEEVSQPAQGNSV
jgi:hypothetical protein